MDLVNKGEYTDSTGPDVIKEICERSRLGLIAALAERIDFNKDYTLSFKEDTYERVTESGNLMHGIKMMVSADSLVRCKECKKSHIDGKTTHYLWCTEWGRSTDVFGYCERGEREGE